MKKIVSLLAVALLATTFAAGCGKLTDCDKTTDKATCHNKANFENDKLCAFNDTKNKCEVYNDAADAKLCNDENGNGEDACKAVQLSEAGRAHHTSCKFNKTNNKCTLI